MVFKVVLVQGTRILKMNVRDKMKFHQKKKHGSDKNFADYSSKIDIRNRGV